MKLSPRIVTRLRTLVLGYVGDRPADFIIGGAERPYMFRWWVIPRNKLFNIYLHRFVRSDDDRSLHDHPWLNCSVLLEGEYTEHTIAAGGVAHHAIYRTGTLKFRRAIAAHRVELHAGPCLSLFITGPVIREWGFHCPAGWRPWKRFVDNRDKGSIGRGCE